MARLVSRGELARLAGVTPAAITKAAKKHFPDACVGVRVDLDAQTVVDWLAGKGVAPTPPPILDTTSPFAPTVRRPANAEHHAPEHRESPIEEVTWDDIERYAHKSLDWLVAKFGTATVFTDWLDARKRISDIREKDLKNDAMSGRLIQRELVQTHVFSAIEEANRRLLRDASTTITRRLYAAASSGTDLEEAEKMVREIISTQLRPVRDTAARVLRGG
jgi:hypothetical protein